MTLPIWKITNLINYPYGVMTTGKNWSLIGCGHSFTCQEIWQE
jgi:hypothetical protein